MQKLMLQIMGAVAEFERANIRERQREGIARDFGITRQTLFRTVKKRGIKRPNGNPWSAITVG